MPLLSRLTIWYSAGLGHAHAGGDPRVHSAQLAVGLHHAGHVGVLDGDDDVVEIELLQQADSTGRFPPWPRAPGAPYFARMCFSRLPPFYTDVRMGIILLLAGLHHGLDPVVVADVAGVDADLVHTNVGAGQRHLVVKVDIRHDGDVHCVSSRPRYAGIRRAGNGHAQDLSSPPPHSAAWATLPSMSSTGTFSMVCTAMGVVAAANGHIADLHFSFQLPHGRFPFRITLPR